MNPLLALLGQAAGVDVGTMGQPQSVPAPPITVTGQQPEPMERMPIDSIPEGMDNGMILEEAARARGEAPPRSGLFGMKGTLRDVLGTVGDAFLIQSGNNPIYSPIRRNENMADAMAGFTGGPEGQQAAMERLAAGGFGDQAFELAKQAQAQLNQNLTQQLNQAEFGADREDAATKRYGEGSEMFARVMGATNAETYERMKPILQRMKEAYGLGDEFMIPDTFDNDYTQSIAYSGMPTSRQFSTQQGEQRIQQGERRLDQGDYRNETGRISATRPRASSQPRAQTDSERAIAIQDKPASERTPGERAWLQRYNRPVGGSSGQRREVPRTNGSRFR